MEHNITMVANGILFSGVEPGTGNHILALGGIISPGNGPGFLNWFVKCTRGRVDITFCIGAIFK